MFRRPPSYPGTVRPVSSVQSSWESILLPFESSQQYVQGLERRFLSVCPPKLSSSFVSRWTFVQYPARWGSCLHPKTSTPAPSVISVWLSSSTVWFRPGAKLDFGRAVSQRVRIQMNSQRVVAWRILRIALFTKYILVERSWRSLATWSG